MTLKGVIDRKLVLLIVSPLLRRLGTFLAAYLAAKGAPAESLEQLLTAVGVVLGLSFDIVLASIHNRKTEIAAQRSILDSFEKRSADDAFYEPMR